MTMNAYDINNKDWLNFTKQRPIQLSTFIRNTGTVDMTAVTSTTLVQDFINEFEQWINSHQHIKYHGLNTFPIKDVILGTTHAMDDLHWKYKNNIAVYEGEYKYHDRLTNGDIKKIKSADELIEGEHVIISYPSCITTDFHSDFPQLLKVAEQKNISIHIDGAWFGCCRNFELDVSNPVIKSVFVSMSKGFGMGGNRIGVRWSRKRQNGPVTIMNEHDYVNRSDCVLGLHRIKEYGADYLWNTYKDIYSKVCKDWNLKESNAFHVAKTQDNKLVGIRTPLRFLIDGKVDVRGLDKSLNKYESKEFKK